MNGSAARLVGDALAGLRGRIEMMNDPRPRRVYDNPAEAVGLADFPCVVLSLDPGRADHSFMRKGVGVYHYRFFVAVWVFVGTRQTSLPELHRRLLAWPVALGCVLLADQRLGDGVSWSGEGGATGQVFSHSVGVMQWGDGEYFGLKAVLPLSIVLPTVFG